MKRRLALLLALAMLLVGMAALAESEYTYYPEMEDYVGLWYVDDYIMQIEHMADDESLLKCDITQYTSDTEGVHWVYEGCSYDDVGKALTSLETGVKTSCTFNDAYELIPGEQIYDDGAASFALNEDGTLTWTDFKQTPGENEIVFERLVTMDDLTPEERFEGTWSCDRASITIDSLDDVIYATVVWGGSAWEVAQWEYSDCVYDEEDDCLVTGKNGVKAILTYGEDGEIADTEQVYDDGSAVFRLEEGYLLWEDAVENAGDGMRFEPVFEFDAAIPVEDLELGFIAPVAGLEEGTAGASLKLAQAACEVTGFTAALDLSEVGEDDLTYCVLLSMESLGEMDVEEFAQKFAAVRGQIDDAFANWEANRPAFEDAGVAGDMDALVADEAARANWERLRDCTQELLDIFVDE